MSKMIEWEVRDGCAIRPSDGRRFSADPSRTHSGDALWRAGVSMAEVDRRVQVRVIRAWGLPSDGAPGGIVEVAIDGTGWMREPADEEDERGRYILSTVVGDAR